MVDRRVEGDLHVMRDIAVGHFCAYDVRMGRERDVGWDGEGDVVGYAGVVVSTKSQHESSLSSSLPVT